MEELKTCFIIIFLSLLLINCSNGPKQKGSTESQKGKILNNLQKEPTTIEQAKNNHKVDLIDYKIIDKKVQDKPKETQVILNALVNPDSSLLKQQLRELLDSLFKEFLNNRNYVFHEKPNSIGIYLYTSKEKSESGMGQWIARLDYSRATGSVPKIDFQEVQFKAMSEKSVVKNGLSIEKRKGIWKKYIELQDKAQKNADKRFPTYGSGSRNGNIVKNMDLVNVLIAKYKKTLAAEYKIKETEIDAIADEAMSNGWPFPKY